MPYTNSTKVIAAGGGGVGKRGWAKYIKKIFVQGKILWKKLRTPSSPREYS